MVQIQAEEEQRYDRQIRLWGAEAQNNLRKSNILLIGLTGLGSEIVKNVVLSGVNSMTLCDGRRIGEIEKSNLGLVESQMLIPFDKKQEHDKSLAELSVPRCNELNPNVNTLAISEIPFEKISENDTKNFNIVICCDQTRETELKCHEACQKSNTPFLVGKTAGYFGQAIIDLGQKYTCQVQQENKNSGKGEIGLGTNATNAKKAKMEEDSKDDDEETDNFKEEILADSATFKDIVDKLSSNDCFKGLRKRELKNLNQAVVLMESSYSGSDVESVAKSMTGKDDFWTGGNAMYHNLSQTSYSTQGQLAAVTAIVGGFMAQEVIRVASRKEKPFNNIFLFDGLNYKGDVMKI